MNNLPAGLIAGSVLQAGHVRGMVTWVLNMLSAAAFGEPEEGKPGTEAEKSLAIRLQA